MTTPTEIIKARAKNHPDAKATYAGVIVSRNENVLPCDGCLWCDPQPENWKAHDEAQRLLRMMEKAK